MRGRISPGRGGGSARRVRDTRGCVRGRGLAAPPRPHRGLAGSRRCAPRERRHPAAERGGKGDGIKVEQAVLGLTALGNMFIELYADRTGSPVDSVIRDAAALAYDDPPS